MRRTGMRNRVAALAAVSAFAIGLTAVAVVAARSGGGAGLERLPSLAGGSRETADMAMAAGSGWSSYVEYVVEGTLPALSDEAPAFRLPTDDDRDAVRRLAGALAMTGTAVKRDRSYVFDDGQRRVTIEIAPGMPWYLGASCPDAPVSSHGDEGVTASLCTVTAIAEPVPLDAPDHGAATTRGHRSPESGSASSGGGWFGSTSGSVSTSAESGTSSEPGSPPAPPDGAKPEPFVPGPRPMPEPPKPAADLPSREEAERIGRGVFERLGVATDTFRLEGGEYSWQAFVSPPVGGLPVVGLEQVVSIGSKGTVQGGNGSLLAPKRIGDYPLAGVEAGLARLRAGGGVGAMPMPDIAVGAPEPYCPDTADCPAPPSSSGPVTVTITGVHLGLQHVADALVPVYVFETKDRGELAVPAVTDRWLEETNPTRGGDDGPLPDDGMSTGSCAAAVSGQGSAVGGEVAEAPNAPLVVEVCVEPAKAKVGQEVTFTVTVKDPDAEIYDEVCAGPLVDFGDQEHVMRTMCGHVCDVDKDRVTITERKAGELTRTFTHAYAKPGTYTARFAYRSEPCSKWSSKGETTTTVHVVG